MFAAGTELEDFTFEMPLLVAFELFLATCNRSII